MSDLSKLVNVSWTETRTIRVWPKACSICNAITPLPSDADLAAFAKLPGAIHLHPFGDFSREYQWRPEGWSQDAEHGLLCAGCTSAGSMAKSKALEARRT